MRPRFFCLLLLAVLLQAGCQGRSAADQAPAVCFAFQDLETEFWVASHRAITEVLEAEGVRVVERNTNEDANRQLEQIRAVLEPLGKWKPVEEEEGHVILGGLDGDQLACQLMRAGYVDADERARRRHPAR